MRSVGREAFQIAYPTRVYVIAAGQPTASNRKLLHRVSIVQVFPWQHISIVALFLLRLSFVLSATMPGRITGLGSLGSSALKDSQVIGEEKH